MINECLVLANDIASGETSVGITPELMLSFASGSAIKRIMAV